VLPKPVDEVCDGRVHLNPLLLKRLRQTIGLSQEALAHACSDNRLCLSLASIKRAEGGKPVLYRTARHLASFYRTELEVLLLAPTTAGSNTVAPGLHVSTQAVRTAASERRRNLPTMSVIYFTLDRHDFNDLAQRKVAESGAFAINNLRKPEFAIVFGAPAHRCTDALAALRCAVGLKACTSSNTGLILRRCAMTAVFNDPLTANLNLTDTVSNNAILVETPIAIQLDALAQFELSDNLLLGCRRFLCFNGVQA
jgi:hypothetical protein